MKEQLLLNLDPELKQRVKKQADSENRTMTNFIVNVLDKYLNEQS